MNDEKNKDVKFSINKEQKVIFKQLCLKQNTNMSKVIAFLIGECVRKNEKEIKEFINSDKFYDLKTPLEVINDSKIICTRIDSDTYHYFKVFCALRSKTQSYMLSLLINDYLKN